MAGVLTINFNSLPSVGDSFLIKVRFLSNTGLYNTVSLRSDFVLGRQRNYEVTIGNSTDELASNFIRAFNVDQQNTGGSGNLVAELPGVPYAPYVVQVHLNNPGWEFVSITGTIDFITYTIENQPAEIPKTVEFTGYDYGASSCDTPVALFNLTGGTESYNAYVDGALTVSGQSSPISIPLDRNRASRYSFTFTDSSGTDIGAISFITPRRISQDKISVLVIYTDQGATLSIKVQFVSSHNLPLSFSLDGVNYSEENVFTGQTEGSYTVYVKDAFGCVTTKNFTVDGSSTVTETNFEVSDINPIRYSIVEDGKKNRYNTLSHEQLKNIPYPFIQYFTDEDTPITQIKTNAQYLNIFAFDCDGNTTALSPVKRSNHMNQTYKTTATKFSTENSKLGIYFGVVDVLDVLTDEVIESKDFGYQVPSAFNKPNGYINLGGTGMVAIDSIIYDESYEAFVLELDIHYTAAPAATTIESRYNIQNYEIYEFVAPMVDLPDSFNIVMEAGQSAAEVEFTFISERIEKTKDTADLAEIIYWHSQNLGGMNYATGVVHTLRLHGVVSRLSDMQTVEGYNGDTERYNTNNEVFDGEEFIFLYLSEEMARKLRLILTHDRLFINGVLYRLGDDVPELNSRFTTNICELTAILRKGGDLTETFSREVIEPAIGVGVDEATYNLEQAITAAKGKALILWKK